MVRDSNVTTVQDCREENLSSAFSSCSFKGLSSEITNFPKIMELMVGRVALFCLLGQLGEMRNFASDFFSEFILNF